MRDATAVLDGSVAGDDELGPAVPNPLEQAAIRGLGRAAAYDGHRHLHAGTPHLGQVHDEIALEHADAPHAHLVAQASRVAVDGVLEHAGLLGSLKLLVGSTGCSSRPPTSQAV